MTDLQNDLLERGKRLLETLRCCSGNQFCDGCYDIHQWLSDFAALLAAKGEGDD